MKLNMKCKLFMAIVVGLSLASCLNTQSANALPPPSAFNAGNIIDNGTFFNSAAMNTAEVQAFLNSKMPICDTNGTQPSSHPNGSGGYYTRAQWGQMNGNPAPYVCLKDYSQSIPATPADTYCTGAIASANRTAAQIITDVSIACSINPQVLVVLLQKEQGLVTDDWPWVSQYKTATGYGCPDSGASCNTSYYGFFNQVYNAAHQFQRYGKQSEYFKYHANESKYISWQAPHYINNQWVDDCSGSSVYIHNQATANLYNYTPYQPNQASLNAGYGTGDYCSSYGNRNFWIYFNDWFDTLATVQDNVSVRIISAPDASPARGQTITYTFAFKNNLSTDILVDAVGVVGRLNSVSSNINRDLGWQQGPITLKGGAEQQFTFTSIVKDVGTSFLWPAIYYKGGYVQYNNWGSSFTSRPPNFTLSQAPTTNAANVYAGQDVTFSAVIKNNEANPINYEAIGIPVKFYDQYNYDAVWAGPGVIGAGAELPLSGTRKIDKPGPFSYWVSTYSGGTYSTIGTVKKFNATVATPNFSVSGLTFSNTNPVKGEKLSDTFTVTNNLPIGIDVDAVGTVGRLGTFSGANRDIGWQGPVHFNAGETKSFTGYSRTITDVGTHYYWIGVLYQGSFIQYNNWGSTIVSQAPSFSVSGLSFSNTSPAKGEDLAATFTVTNKLSVPVDVDAVGIVGRLGTFSGANRDIGWQGPVHFNAGETKSFTGYSRTITDVGTHYYWIGVFDEGNYIQYNNWGSTIVSH